MNRRKWLLWPAMALVMLCLGSQPSLAQEEPAAPPVEGGGVVAAAKLKKVTQADRKAAADRLKEVRATLRESKQAKPTGANRNAAALLPGEPVVKQGDIPDYYSPTVPNWNYTPPLRKFVDTLPLLGPAGSNNLQQYIPIAVPDKATYPGLTPGSTSDYYEIAVVQFTQQMHSDLPETTFRGYVQIDTPAIPDTATRYALTYPDGSPIFDGAGQQVYSVDKPRYLGPVVVSQRDRPVRIKFTNYLPKGIGGDLFIPVDKTVMGAGMGPNMAMPMSAMAMGTTATIMTHYPHTFKAGQKVMLHGFTPNEYNGEFVVLAAGLGPKQFQVTLESAPAGPATVVGEAMEMYTENRSVVHLHGGRTPWISDGTPHQWVTPAGENTNYPQGVSVKEVPDMPGFEAPDDGSTTLYYTNQQSARLMFYHDHVYGITRLNVYAGEAAGYLIRDGVEDALVAGKYIPSAEIPLVIQDKTFVDAATVGDLDPTWRWGTGADNDGNGFPDYKTGDLWVPHVYMPAQNPYDISGMAAMGRWHYGPWFWPPTTGIGHPPIPNPYYDPINRPWEGELIPDVPDPSMGMEAFNDTPIVNGVAYPTLTVDPKAYRFRILSAANDRFFNLQLYEADPAFEMPGAGLTEVKMVDASPYPSDLTWPQDFAEGNSTWPVDGREGGVPDWNTRGPDWVQIGTEGGFLPMPVVVPQRPVDWNVDVTTFDAGIVNSHSLLLAPAERADVIVDFSAYAGKTLILYNDAPAAFPAPDPRYDYFTGGPDMTDTGGRWPTDPGYGPNTRTIMQIKVNPDPVVDDWLGLAAMNAKWESTATQDGVFKQAQDPIIVTQGELVPGYDQYNKAYNATFPSTYPDWGIARIHNTSLSFKALDGSTATIPLQPKAIQDEMGETFDDYGRMSGKLGLQLPNPPAGGQTFVLQSYVDPVTEVIDTAMTPLTPPLAADGTQLWKITHNGVDVHPIHFHLFDVQLVNRVAWDNNVRLPDASELGWKDTVRVNPLQDTIVALRPVTPGLPFKLPDSVRLLDPAMPAGYQWQSFDPFTADAVTITNQMTNFGWEYMWHCHILSHEEMEMMRPISLIVAPAGPSGLTATAVDGPAVNLAWVNNATKPAATMFALQRATDAAFTQNVTSFSPIDPAVTTLADAPVVRGLTYYYRVRAENDLGYSPWSNTAVVTIPEPVPAGMNLAAYWNDAAVNAIKSAGLTSITAARALAMVHAAMYDGVNSVAGIGREYRITVPNAAGASKEAAASAAAYGVLAGLFPGQISVLDAKLFSAMATVPDGAAKTAGTSVGQAVADAMLVWRSTDHSADMAPMYMGGMMPGQWRPTPPGNMMGMMPLWGTVTPFAMTSGSQFRLAPPPALSSAQYAQDFNEVAAIGALGSATRTQQQTDIAVFWADSPGTVTTVGRWNEIARAEAETRGNTLEQDVTLFAVLNIALADAGISSWDSKYHYSAWRPITAIREAAGDGNAATVPDAAWTPLLTTPAFPEYASAHSTFSGAGAEVLKSFFGTDNANISIPSFDGLFSRSYATYSQAADEAGLSRIYGGIHFRFSKTAGEAAGRTIATYVNARFFAELPGPPTAVTATAGVRQATVTFSPPVSNGGSPVTLYTVTSSLGHTVTGTASPITVTGLQDGTTYTFTVTASNPAGTGPASLPSNAVTTPAPPDPPTLVAATGGIGQATITFTPPVVPADPLSAITQYTVTANTGQTATGTASGITVTGLTFGVTYTFTVTATNAAGTSLPSAPSNSIVLFTVPGAPTNVTAVSGDRQATVFFNPPASNGGSSITSYTVTASPGGATATGPASGIVVPGLRNGTSYTFTVVATNSIGTGPASSPSSPVRIGLPQAPTNLTAVLSTTRRSASAALRWNDNSTNESGFYVWRSTNGGATWQRIATAKRNATSYTATGLSRGRSYLFRIQAYNNYGGSDFTNTVTVVVP